MRSFSSCLRGLMVAGSLALSTAAFAAGSPIQDVNATFSGATGKGTVTTDAQGRSSGFSFGGTQVTLGYATAESPTTLTIKSATGSVTWTATGRDGNRNAIWTNAKGDSWTGYVGSGPNGFAVSARTPANSIGETVVVSAADGKANTTVTAAEVAAEDAEVARLQAVAAAEMKKATDLKAASDARLAALKQQIDAANAADQERGSRGVPLAATRTVKAADGSIIDYDPNGRVIMTTTPNGQATWVRYNDQGQVDQFGIRQPGESQLQQVTYTLQGKISPVGKGTYEGWKGASKTPPFTGGVAMQGNGTFVLVDFQSNVVTAGQPDGTTSVEAGGVRRTTSGDGKRVRIEESGTLNDDGTRNYRIATDFQQDANGPSLVVLDGHTYRRTGNDQWTVDGGNTSEHRAFQFKDNRIVSTVWDGQGHRVVTETRVSGSSFFTPEGKTVVFHPDTDPQDQFLEKQRAALVKMNLVPPDTTPGQFRELYTEAVVTRTRLYEKMIDQRRAWLEQLRARRLLDSDGYEAAKNALDRLQRSANAMGDAIEPGRGILPDRIDPSKVDFARFDQISKANFFDPANPGHTSFDDLDQVLEKYRKELPGWDERGLAALTGAGHAVQGMVQAVVDHPLQAAGIIVLTIAAPEVMIPVLTAAGVVSGGIVVANGISDIREGQRTGNAATYLHGWEQVGNGGTQVGVAVGTYYLAVRAKGPLKAAGEGEPRPVNPVKQPELLRPTEPPVAKPVVADAPPPPPASAFERYGNLRAGDLKGPNDPRLIEIYQEQVVATQRMANEINSALEAEGISARVSPNIKTAASLYSKLVSKAAKKDYPISNVTDLSRGRIDVTTNDLAEVARIDQVLRKKFGLTPDSDASPNFLQKYLQAETPTSGYSRSHLVLKDAAHPNGAQFELQVGTRDLSEFIDAKVGKTTPHDAIYKGDVLGIELKNKGPLGEEYNNLLLEITRLNKAGKPVSSDAALQARIARFKAAVLDGLPDAMKVPDAPPAPPAVPGVPGPGPVGMVPSAGGSDMAAANGGTAGGWNGARRDNSVATADPSAGLKGSAGVKRNGSSL